MNIRLLKKIEREKSKVEQFIDDMRDIFSKTPDETEKKNRLEVLDTFLLLATYARPEMLENEFQIALPNNRPLSKLAEGREGQVDTEHRAGVHEDSSTASTKQSTSSVALGKKSNERVDTITYMCQQLREINGFCCNSFSDDHEVYQDLFSTIKFPTPEKKQAVRTLLSKTISETIFEKTNTASNCFGIAK